MLTQLEAWQEMEKIWKGVTPGICGYYTFKGGGLCATCKYLLDEGMITWDTFWDINEIIDSNLPPHQVYLAEFRAEGKEIRRAFCAQQVQKILDAGCKICEDLDLPELLHHVKDCPIAKAQAKDYKPDTLPPPTVEYITKLVPMESAELGERFLAVGEHPADCFCVECLPTPKEEEQDNEMSNENLQQTGSGRS